MCVCVYTGKIALLPARDKIRPFSHCFDISPASDTFVSLLFPFSNGQRCFDLIKTCRTCKLTQQLINVNYHTSRPAGPVFFPPSEQKLSLSDMSGQMLAEANAIGAVKYN